MPVDGLLEGLKISGLLPAAKRDVTFAVSSASGTMLNSTVTWGVLLDVLGDVLLVDALLRVVVQDVGDPDRLLGLGLRAARGRGAAGGGEYEGARAGRDQAGGQGPP
jgi:hypothetical protein